MPVAVVDADKAGHQVLTEQTTKQALRARFGDEIFHEQGDINRPKLGRLVFGTDPESKTAKTDLESIVHPRIGEILREQIAAAQAQTGIKAVILDAAVLLETGWKEFCDTVVFIDVPEDIRRNRVIQNRNWTAEEFAAREANQLPLEIKKQLSDHVIDNSTTVEFAAQQLRQIVAKIAGSSAKS
jgi:dephospho-CoA kinase